MLLISCISLFLGAGLFLPLLFWSAGTWLWLQGWLYFGLVVVNFTANFCYLWQVNRELISHRMELGAGTKQWDMIWASLFGPLYLSIYLIAAFDAVRFGWSEMVFGWWWLGLMIHVPGALLFARAMGENPFFEKTVRIQTERGQRVIDTGPYGVVRHPGYAGFIGWGMAVPFLLGSWWALIPALLSVLGIVIRTALEDMTLREELEGYEAYTTRVRYKLLPGIW